MNTVSVISKNSIHEWPPIFSFLCGALLITETAFMNGSLSLVFCVVLC
jgi:hypothetical protein